MIPLEAQIRKTIALEGGYVHDPLDNGGETNMGITIPSWKEYCTESRLDNAERPMQSLDIEAAVGFYTWWWHKPELGLRRILDPGCQFVIFDTSVLSGRGTAARWAQDVAVVLQDGRIGPISGVAINRMDPELFIQEMERTAKRYYQGIVDRKPTQGKFRRGWFNRAEARSEFAYRLHNGSKNGVMRMEDGDG